MARLQDKVVIVTGGAQGLGEGIARRLAEGYRRSMPDTNDTLTPAEPRDLADAIAFALRFEGRKRVHQADEYMAAIACVDNGPTRPTGKSYVIRHISARGIDRSRIPATRCRRPRDRMLSRDLE